MIATIVAANRPSGSRSGSKTETVIPRHRWSATSGLSISTRSSGLMPGDPGQSTAGITALSNTSTSRCTQKFCSGTCWSVSLMRVPTTAGPIANASNTSIRVMAVSRQARRSQRPGFRARRVGQPEHQQRAGLKYPAIRSRGLRHVQWPKRGPCLPRHPSYAWRHNCRDGGSRCAHRYGRVKAALNGVRLPALPAGSNNRPR